MLVNFVIFRINYYDPPTGLIDYNKKLRNLGA